MTAAGMGPFEGLNHTATNVTKAGAEGCNQTSLENATEGVDASIIFLFIVVYPFVLLNLAAIGFLLWRKKSESI